MIDTGGSAFPSEEYRKLEGVEKIIRVNIKGMTLRDWFAGQALHFVDCDINDAHEMARHCYAIADAMLKARKETGK